MLPLLLLLAAAPAARRDVLATLFDEPAFAAGELVGVPVPVAPRPAASWVAARLDEEMLEARAAALPPGGELVIPDGRYRGVKLALTVRGSAAAPIVIRPATPGGVTFEGSSRIDLRGEWAVFRGFRFEHCLDSTALQLADCSNVRVTQCHFLQCGKPISTFGHIVEVGLNCDDCRVDHCFFTGSRSMSLAQRVTAGADNGQRNRFDSNLFRDIFRYWVNGQENIQLGQNQRGASGDTVIAARIEGNLFDHAWGDSEVISNKASGNVIRHNTAAWCARSSFTLRGGNEVRFEGNQVIGCANGLRIMGRRHTVTGNLFLAQLGAGIVLETGSAADDNQVATEGTVIEDNTFVECRPALVGMAPSEGRPHLPRGVRFEGNLLLGEGTVVDAAHLRELTQAGNRTTGDAPSPPAECPAIPPAPLVSPEIQGGERVAEQPELALREQRWALPAELPPAAVIQWEHQADSFADVTSLALVDPDGVAYELEWGGAEADGKPDGVIALRRRPSEDPVTLAADLVQYRQDFVYQGWMARTNNERTTPDPAVWHRFTLLTGEGRLILMLGDARRTGPGVPILVWEDPLPPLRPSRLELIQRGAGRVRNLMVWRRRSPSLAPPAAVTELSANSAGAGHTALRWRAPAPGLSYAVARDGAVLAEGLSGAGFDDFTAPVGRHRYTVTAVDPLGRSSPGASLEAAPREGGTWFGYVPADAAQPGAPMVTARGGGLPYLYAPGVDSSTARPPDGPATVFRMAVPRAGEYALWGLVQADDDGSDSFHLAVGEAWRVWYTGVHAGWTWVRAAESVRLPAGEVVLQLKHREPNTRLAALLVTDDPDWRPAAPADRR